MTSKNTICLWSDGAAVDVENFYGKTFPDSAVGAIMPRGGAETSLKSERTVRESSWNRHSER